MVYGINDFLLCIYLTTGDVEHFYIYSLFQTDRFMSIGA